MTAGDLKKNIKKEIYDRNKTKTIKRMHCRVFSKEPFIISPKNCYKPQRNTAHAGACLIKAEVQSVGCWLGWRLTVSTSFWCSVKSREPGLGRANTENFILPALKSWWGILP